MKRWKVKQRIRHAQRTRESLTVTTWDSRSNSVDFGELSRHAMQSLSMLSATLEKG